MSKFTIITDRAMDFVSQAGAHFKDAMPDADKLFQTGPPLDAGKWRQPSCAATRPSSLRRRWA